MNADLVLYGRPITSVFELLGTKENDITFSLGWALAHSNTLREALVRSVFKGDTEPAIDRVSLQDRLGEHGVTDIELTGRDTHIVIEAKRGWEVPSRDQLAQYAPRLLARGQRYAALVTMSECSPALASAHLDRDIGGIPVVHFGWRDVDRLAAGLGTTHAEKRLLAELRDYFQRIVKMQNQESNLVFVVSLSEERPPWSTLSWLQMVNERNRYFHPAGVDGWPKEPPNYIGFRYGGQLRTIHHIDEWKVTQDINAEMHELSPGRWDVPHYLYTLGPAIIPPGVIKTGNIYPSGRVWAMLDLLLTCNTISEARDKTKARRSE